MDKISIKILDKYDGLTIKDAESDEEVVEAAVSGFGDYDEE